MSLFDHKKRGGCMDDPQEKDSSPTYMNLGQMSQYELCEFIDSKAREADQQMHPDGDSAGLELVLCQLADHVQDLFGVSVQPDMDFGRPGHPTFDKQVAEFTFACAKAYRARKGNDANIYQFRMMMKRALDSSFLDSKDIMKMQQPWRYEIQDRLATIQGRILNGIAHYTF